MAKFKVSLYNSIYYTQEVEANTEEEAEQHLWETGPAILDLPEGFSIGDPSAWELEY